MLPKNKKLRRQRKDIQDEFSEKIESDIVNDSKPVERPAEMDDLDLYFDDPHQPLDDGCQLTY
jgi:hypothetical protein